MMTIKDFAKMCGCNTQTLRYYDRINLLKPAKVDDMTGYRYYEVGQAFDYIKIKNLQMAEFSIDEIKKLLFMSDGEVYRAFQDKIAFHKERLSKVISR
ncbi:MAG: MerR family transcriptional regulator [Bacillota bacterium]|nr:MerR family transcriptional regulator [Bacillota bacterium]